jgi:tetratricopeptide (TPR) repeat protein
MIRLGSIARSQGNYERANRLHEEGLVLSREFGEKLWIVYALRNLGFTCFAQGNNRQAEKRFEEALMICREIGEKFERAIVLYGLGRVAQAQGDHVSSRARFAEGITIHHDKAIVAQHLEGFALLATAEDQLERGARLFGASQALHPPFRFEMSAKERVEHDQAVAAICTALSEQAFAAAWESGKTMTLDEAIKYALEQNSEIAS